MSIPWCAVRVMLCEHQFLSLESLHSDMICPLSIPRYSKLYFTIVCGTPPELATVNYPQIKLLICQPGVMLCLPYTVSYLIKEFLGKYKICQGVWWIKTINVICDVCRTNCVETLMYECVLLFVQQFPLWRVSTETRSVLSAYRGIPNCTSPSAVELPQSVPL